MTIPIWPSGACPFVEVFGTKDGCSARERIRPFVVNIGHGCMEILSLPHCNHFFQSLIFLEKRGSAMKTSAWSRSHFQRGMVAALPIVVGYVPIAVAFGVIAVQSGMTASQAMAMSLMVYAGASQFMAVNMLAAGAGALEIVLATLILNFRHFVMSLSLMNKFAEMDKKWKIPLSYWITDETFAVASLGAGERGGGKDAQGFLAGLFFTAYASWVIGTWIGAALSGIIPPSASSGMVIALYAMFIGLLIPAARENFRGGAVALVSMGLSSLFSGFVNSGWAIVLATVLGAAAGIWLFKREGDGNE
jgi:4-azaleucine resistance transporter AzlC